MRRQSMEKKCPCANPPGGEITCSDDQLAICGVIDGELVVGCFDKPSSVMQIENKDRRTAAVANWVLSRITGTTRNPDREISSEEQVILGASAYTSRDGTTRVKFSIPSDLDLQAVEKSTPAVMSR
jgi:hypothetical protein